MRVLVSQRVHNEDLFFLLLDIRINDHGPSSAHQQERLDGGERVTNLSSRWSTRSRYASKLDVDRGMDPIEMGMCSLATAESLFEMQVISWYRSDLVPDILLLAMASGFGKRWPTTRPSSTVDAIP